MLFIKTSECFTVQCSFTLPDGAGAVIPVSEGSDGGHYWPVGVAAHHQSTEPLRTTLQLLSSLMGSLGGESQGWLGIKIPGLAPTRRLPCGAQKICCTCPDCWGNMCVSGYTEKPQKSLFGSGIMCVHTQIFSVLSCIHPLREPFLPLHALTRLNPTPLATQWESIRWWRAGSRSDRRDNSEF